VLGASAAIIIAIVATNQSTGGLLGMLDELRPQYAMANVIMFVCAVMGALLSVLIMLFGRTTVGTIFMACVLIGYGLLLNGSDQPGSWLFSKSVAEPIVEYTINVGGTNVEGAELWVNGVCLGKMPYTGTLDEFEAKVPYWPQPPADYETDKVEIPQYRSWGTSTSNHRRWARFELPERPSWPGPGPSRPTTTGPSQRKTYYARVRYAGQWGLASGGRGGGGGSHLTYRANSYFDVIFPDRQKRLDALLDKARLADYRVGAQWFQAIETYDEDGWIALRTAADDEPRMMEVLDAWATWRYGLDKVTDAESAWRTFARIRDEAETQRQYLTPSVAGRAVELLAPKLPRQRLVDEAIGMIRNAGSFSYFKWTMNGRLQFGYSQRPGGVGTGGEGSFFSGSASGRAGAPAFPMGGFAVVHAVWMLYDIQPETIQQRVVPEMVCWQYRAGSIDPMLAAAYFGGPAIDKFLLRQDWRAEGRELEWEEQLRMSGAEANKWLYLLAYLNDDAGREFRRKHADAVMNLADKFYEDGFVRWRAEIDFVFMDLWLAKEYWPRFSRLARLKSPDYALETQWRYLLKMGETATVSMFVDAWKETNIALDDFQQAGDLLYQLGPNIQAEVIAQLVQQVEEHPENIARILKGYDSRDRLVTILRSFAHGGKRQAEAERLYRDLQQAEPTERDRKLENIPMWLEHTRPDSPLVEMLAHADDPKLRLMVMGALREHPTPEYRQMLDKLLKDADPAVRTAAKEVAERLKALAAESPSRYASESPSATTEPSTASTRGETR